MQNHGFLLKSHGRFSNLTLLGNRALPKVRQIQKPHSKWNATLSPKACGGQLKGRGPGCHLTLYWVAVKELKLSYYIGETLLCTMYTHYGNLI